MCGSCLGPYGGWCPTGQRLTCGRETHQSFKKIPENAASCSAATNQPPCAHRTQLCSVEPRRSFPLKDPVSMQQTEKMRGYDKPQVAETLWLRWYGHSCGTAPRARATAPARGRRAGRREGESTARALQNGSKLLSLIETTGLHATDWNSLDPARALLLWKS